MKSLLLAAAVAFALTVGAFATTTDALQLTANGLTATITDNGACVGSGCGSLSGDINLAAGTDTISGSIDGWTINIVSGTSHSPGLVPFGLDLTSLTATCSGGPCTTSPLHVLYSDINFNQHVTGFTTTYSGTVTGTGNTSESAYYDNSNTLFAETNSIGTVGPFSAPGGAGSTTHGASPAALYSLTLDQVFNSIDGSPVSFSVDGNITGVPEPIGVMLFGTLVLLCGISLRRKLQKVA